MIHFGRLGSPPVIRLRVHFSGCGLDRDLARAAEPAPSASGVETRPTRAPTLALCGSHTSTFFFLLTRTTMATGFSPSRTRTCCFMILCTSPWYIKAPPLPPAPQTQSLASFVTIFIESETYLYYDGGDVAFLPAVQSCVRCLSQILPNWRTWRSRGRGRRHQNWRDGGVSEHGGYAQEGAGGARVGH